MKVTFATLKKYARQGKLQHKVRGEFSGMTDGMEFNEKPWELTTLDNLDWFKVTGNYLQQQGELIKLSNCCFYVDFKIV